MKYRLHGGGGGEETQSAPTYLIHFWHNHHHTWYGGTLGQNLSKTLASLMASLV